MRTDKTAMLASERQQPMTAAEHAEETGRGGQFTRDVPRSCTCNWLWSGQLGRYIRIAAAPECAWHAGEDHR